MMSAFDMTCTITELPPFIPNDYLFEHHADKGKEKWEIYAWAIRDIIAKYGGLEKSDIHYREKSRYEEMLGLRETKKSD